MSFSLSQLILISATYLLTLFGVAWATERGWVPSRVVRHPITYILSLGVYTSAWAFFGSVGLAYQYGYGFLAIYLGLSGAFLLAPVLLYPILRLTRTHQLSSLADLMAFRFRSSWVGAITTIGMLLAALPLLALQIQSVTDTISIITGQPIQEYIALAFCILITLFSILFGARHIVTREKHEGLVFAIAFESLVKLLALLTIGAYALFVVFDGPSGLDIWLSQHPNVLENLRRPLEEGPWRTLLLLFFASAIAMPHMYHMIFTENLNRRAMVTASWGVPLFMLLMSLPILPILWAGFKLNAPTSPEYFTLGLGLAVESERLTLLAFLGGLSAASGVIIVLTLAMSGMVMNHIVLPLYQPPANGNIYRWLKWARRALIFAIVLAGYSFYVLLRSEQDLSNLGLVAFFAALQFLPGVLATLYWQKANRYGFISGAIAGLLVWAVGMLWPMLSGVEELYLPLVDYTLRFTGDRWHLSITAALIANSIIFILVSLITRSSPEEQSAAQACAINNTRHAERRRELYATTPQELATELAKPLGPVTAQREVEKALKDLKFPFDENRPFALRRVRDRIEANLSGLMGPSVAQDLVDTFLPFKVADETYTSGDIHFIESRLEDYQLRLTGLAAELDTLRRYHRQTLQDLPMGVCSLAKDYEILMWNRALEDLTGITATRVVGSRLNTIDQPWRELLMSFAQGNSSHLYKHTLRGPYQSRWLNLHKAAIDEPSAANTSGLVLLVEDATETRLLEDKLVHSERLASIGRLAAGVAHEIGNPITGIACLAQNLRYERDEDPEITEISSQIIEQTKRVSRIVQSLMSFSHSGHQQHESHEAVSLFDVASEAIHLLSFNKLGKTVHFFNLCDTQHWTLGDPQRLAQVLINLLSNARDASPELGQIYIRTKASHSQVELSIEDQGSGISASNLEHLFEPFFTTKDPGKGTGLGLALVYSIIEEHQGDIQVDSPADLKLQRGTRFRISLPRHTPSSNPTVRGLL